MTRRRRAAFARPIPYARGAALALTIAALVAGCTHERVPLVAPTVVSPRYPDFVFPAAPPAVGTPALADQQHVAWQFLQAGDLKTAERAFTALAKQHPGFYPAEAGAGYVSLGRKDAASAVSRFDRALAGHPAYAPALAGKGEALLALGRTGPALAAFEEALAADPTLTTLRSRVDLLRFHSAQQQIAAARRAADAGQYTDAEKAYRAAIAASPQSAFLYRELADVELKGGALDAALTDAQKATGLDPNDAHALTVLAEVYEARQDWARADQAYTAALAIEPSPELATRAAAAREKAAFASMPDEYKSIGSSPAVTRAQLAALIGVQLGDLLRTAPAHAVVVTDTRGNWATPWIMAVTRAGVMEPYPNHTFQPRAIVRRADFAQTVSRVLDLIGTAHPRAAARWRQGRPQFTDVPPAHFSYPAAALAVTAGVMTTGDGGAFQLSRPVTGAEALGAVEKLARLANAPVR
ncbi:MAG TPA: tetratricopeptide repeat protein [Vicinamibacterales bacterium]|nr:tetratricopeptide repeat protein [Vicinamibacterales bacterium]